MSIRVGLEPDAITLTPGVPSIVRVSVFNATPIVDEFVVAPVGIDPRWFTAAPPRVSVLPNREGSIALTVNVPHGAALVAGTSTVGIKVTSVARSDVTRVEELTVSVAPVGGVALALAPQTVRGGRRARVTATITNSGNRPVDVSLRGSDPESAIRFAISPVHQSIPPFGTATATIAMSSPRPSTGPASQRAFTIAADGAGERVTAQGTFVQKPRFARGFLKAAGWVTVLALIAGVGFGVPQVRDAIGDLVSGNEATPAAATGVTTTTGTTVPPGPADALAMLAITPRAEGSSVVFEISTNLESTVTVEITGGLRQGSTGTTHYLEFGGQSPGTLDWTATASASGQEDDVASGSLTIPYVYGFLELTDGPTWVSNTTTTQADNPFGVILRIGTYFAYVAYPQQAFLGSDCPSAYSGPTVSTLAFDLAADGSGTVTIAAGWCWGLIPSTTATPDPLPAGIDLGEQVAIPPGWEPYEQVVPLFIDAGDGTLSLTVRIARVVSQSPPP